MSNELIERIDKLKSVRTRLKCGEYDGNDIMQAWIAIDELIKCKAALAQQQEAHKIKCTSAGIYGTYHECSCGKAFKINTEGGIAECLVYNNQDKFGEYCQCCGKGYNTVYRVPNNIWTEIAPGDVGPNPEHQLGGLLCVDCAAARASEKGIELYFDASVGDWESNRQQEAEPYGYLRENDGAVQLSIGPHKPADRSSGYATPWAAIYSHPPKPAALPAQQGEVPEGFKQCPISGRPFWGNIEHPKLGLVATYGGPFDTYTIPAMGEDGELRCERFDQDEGAWVEGGEPFGWFYENQQAKPAAQPHEVNENLTLDGCMETMFRVAEYLGIDYEQARKEQVPPSQVYIKAIESRQSAQPVPYPNPKSATELMRENFERLFRASSCAYPDTLRRDDRDGAAHYYNLKVESDWVFYQRAWADAIEAAQPQVPDGWWELDDATLSPEEILNSGISPEDAQNLVFHMARLACASKEEGK